MISEEMNLLLFSLSRRKSLAQIEGAMVETEITIKKEHSMYSMYKYKLLWVKLMNGLLLTSLYSLEFLKQTHTTLKTHS